jgi:hypothetical protein
MVLFKALGNVGISSKPIRLNLHSILFLCICLGRVLIRPHKPSGIFSISIKNRTNLKQNLIISPEYLILTFVMFVRTTLSSSKFLSTRKWTACKADYNFFLSRPWTPWTLRYFFSEGEVRPLRFFVINNMTYTQIAKKLQVGW